MAAIKRFFEKRKLDVKFKRAGEGHRLDQEGSTSPIKTTKQPEFPTQRTGDQTQQQKMAADAALARLSQPKPGAAGGGNKTSSLRSELRREMEAEQQATELAARYANRQEVSLTAAPIAGRVMFHCALTGPDLVLPKEEMENHIEEFLLTQLPSEPAMTSALMIYTLNRSPEAVKQGVEIIGKYLENIAQHPGEEKYRKIRVSNKSLQEKVLSLRGAEEFLQGAGFRRMMCEVAGGSPEEFLVYSPESEQDESRLTELREILQNAEPIRPELDRSVRAFHPSSNAMKMSVPDEFYRISPEEYRREQQAKTEAVEQFGMLRTKQMRERDRIKELRRYRYCLIRLRFPDGVLLQGTFAATEKLSAVFAFVSENLEFACIPFTLSTSLGQALSEESCSLAELDLAPASLLNLTFDTAILADIAASQGLSTKGPFLKGELMAKIASL